MDTKEIGLVRQLAYGLFKEDAKNGIQERQSWEGLSLEERSRYLQESQSYLKEHNEDLPQSVINILSGIPDGTLK